MLPQLHTEDDRSVREALMGGDRQKWEQAMKNGLRALQDMKCWDIIKRLGGDSVIHKKFVLKRKKDEKSQIRKHKARLVICENKKIDSQEDMFSLIAPHFIMKLVLCISIQYRWNLRHLDFENAFQNGHWERPAFAELREQNFPREMKRGFFTKLCRSLYGMKNVAKAQKLLLLEVLNQLGSK